MFYTIKGFERYGVSRDGIIKNLQTGKLIKLTPDKDGYMCFISCINYNKKCLKVHRVVAEMFIPNPLCLPQVNHKNYIKSDNNAENLEWVIDQRNKQHLWEGGKMKAYSSGRFGSDAVRAIPVLQFDKMGRLLREWGSIVEAAQATGTTNISACCKGKLKTAGGYKWAYQQ